MNHHPISGQFPRWSLTSNLSRYFCPHSFRSLWPPNTVTASASALKCIGLTQLTSLFKLFHSTAFISLILTFCKTSLTIFNLFPSALITLLMPISSLRVPSFTIYIQSVRISKRTVSWIEPQLIVFYVSSPPPRRTYVPVENFAFDFICFQMKCGPIQTHVGPSMEWVKEETEIGSKQKMLSCLIRIYFKYSLLLSYFIHSLHLFFNYIVLPPACALNLKPHHIPPCPHLHMI